MLRHGAGFWLHCTAGSVREVGCRQGQCLGKQLSGSVTGEQGGCRTGSVHKDWAQGSRVRACPYSKRPQSAVVNYLLLPPSHVPSGVTVAQRRHIWRLHNPCPPLAALCRGREMPRMRRRGCHSKRRKLQGRQRTVSSSVHCCFEAQLEQKMFQHHRWLAANDVGRLA